jgi:hypothetical protein
MNTVPYRYAVVAEVSVTSVIYLRDVLDDCDIHGVHEDLEDWGVLRCCDVRDFCDVLDDQDDFDGGGAHVSLDDRGVLEPLFIVMSLCLCSNVP